MQKKSVRRDLNPRHSPLKGITKLSRTEIEPGQGGQFRKYDALPAELLTVVALLSLGFLINSNSILRANRAARQRVVKRQFVRYARFFQPGCERVV